MAKKKVVKSKPKTKAKKKTTTRSRNKDGQLRDKRDDTNMGTIEKKYNRDFGVRSDMHLGTFLAKKKIKSLNDLINSKLGKKK